MLNNFVDIVWKIDIAIMVKDQLRQLNQVKWSFISGMKMKDKRAGKFA
jgi:hypothetical protein